MPNTQQLYRGLGTRLRVCVVQNKSETRFLAKKKKCKRAVALEGDVGDEIFSHQVLSNNDNDQNVEGGRTSLPRTTPVCEDGANYG